MITATNCKMHNVNVIIRTTCVISKLKSNLSNTFPLFWVTNSDNCSFCSFGIPSPNATMTNGCTLGNDDEWLLNLQTVGSLHKTALWSVDLLQIEGGLLSSFWGSGRQGRLLWRYVTAFTIFVCT